MAVMALVLVTTIHWSGPRAHAQNLTLDSGETTIRTDTSAGNIGVGTNSGDTGTLTMTGGTLTGAGTLTVGSIGTGTLTMNGVTRIFNSNFTSMIHSLATTFLWAIGLLPVNFREILPVLRRRLLPSARTAWCPLLPLLALLLATGPAPVASAAQPVLSLEPSFTGLEDTPIPLTGVTTLAGSGTSGNVNGTGAAAQFAGLNGVAVDTAGNVYVSDSTNGDIRKITSAGVVTTLAGSGTQGYSEGSGTAAQFSAPYAVAVDAEGYVYVADQGNNRIRKISPAGVVTTLAGTGTYASLNGTAAAAQFAGPNAVAVDASGNLYVTESGYPTTVRKISRSGAGVSVSDADGGTLTAALSVTNGTLTATLTGGATVSTGALGSANVTLSGTPTQLNAALLTLAYQGTTDFNGADTLTVSVSDGGTPVTATSTITVTPVNDAPTLAVLINQTTTFTTSGSGQSGTDSVFGTITALGGGGGSGRSSAIVGANGGSGGGGGFGGGGGTKTQGNSGGGTGFGSNGGAGFNGGNYGGGGGGGAGGPGGMGGSAANSGGAGGAGKTYSLSGAEVSYAGGGGGGGGGVATAGGGNGGNAPAVGAERDPGKAATANTGGGGGGGHHGFSAGGSGGSGIVIVRSLTSTLDATLSYVDTAAAGTFTAGTGTLVGADADTGTTLTYGITGGTLAGGVVTQTGTYGTLAVTAATGVYAFTPNAAAINALSASATETYAVSVSDGTATTTTNVVINLTGVNDTPTLAAIAVSGTEDTTLTFTAANFTGAYNDPESTALVSITVATLPATGLLKLSGTNVTASQVITAADLPNLTYVPAANENGAKTFTVRASDGALSSEAATVTMTLTAVNDAPSFALPRSMTVQAWGSNSSGQTTVPAGALSGVTAISAGGHHTVALKDDGTVVAWGDNTAGQTTVPGGLSGVTAISAGFNHTVALKAGEAGQAGGTVVAWGDNGSGQTTVPVGLSGVTAIAAGGYHTVALQALPAATVAEDSGAYAGGANAASAISTGPADESAQTASFTVTNNNNALFSVQPAINASGTLTFTPAANANGTATVTVTVQDNGGTAIGGVATSAAQTFTISVTAVNDAPTLTSIANQTTMSGTATAALAFTVGDAETAPGSLGLSATSSNLAFVPNANIVFGGSGAARTVTVTPVAGQSGTVTITLTASDGSLTGSTSFNLSVDGMGIWAQTYFGSATVNVGNEEDFDSDGVSNLLEFAFGTLPNTNASGSASLQYTGTFAGGGTLTSTGQPRTGFEPTSMGIDFRALFVRRNDYAASGLTYTPQFSAILNTWQDSATVPTVLADDGTYQIVSVPYPPFIGGKKARFFRISVTKAP